LLPSTTVEKPPIPIYLMISKSSMPILRGLFFMILLKILVAFSQMSLVWMRVMVIVFTQRSEYLDNLHLRFMSGVGRYLAIMFIQLLYSD